MDDNCIFCKLANKVFATNVIYEDEDFTVILDNGPATRGHALILPKEHYANLYEIPEELVGKAFVLAKKMAVKMTGLLKCEGFNLVQNNGTVAGQTVFHFHIHLIPRYSQDHQNILWEPRIVEQNELEELKNLLSQ
ncbi:MAG: HIT domain-containing protein [Clostridiales bacterium]|nr:HIT domain-containing protein [Clostridiales bacterium]